MTGSAATGSTVTLYTNSTCTSAVAATGTAAAFASPGIAVSVADDSTTTFYATASNSAGTSPCSSTSVTYVEDSTAPSDTAVTASPTSPGNSRSPQWSFSGSGTFECRLSGGSLTPTWASCTSPKTYSLTGQPDGIYTFEVRATDSAGNTGAPVSSSYALDTTGLPSGTYSLVGQGWDSGVNGIVTFTIQ